ncbi:hypothetical protein VNO77_30514 [Canavalia gladiata]|uniref:Uncharacterized protein n=1 Tax=Canavalia gladiata TaxID=3824 RepID=A0AAN9Q4A4_CANGL
MLSKLSQHRFGRRDKHVTLEVVVGCVATVDGRNAKLAGIQAVVDLVLLILLRPSLENISSRELQDKAPIYSSCNQADLVSDLVPVSSSGQIHSLVSYLRWTGWGDIQNSCKAPIAASGLVIVFRNIEYRDYQYDSPIAGPKSVTTKWLRQILVKIIRDYSYIATVHNPYHFTISVPGLESVSQAYNLNQRASKL